MKHIILIITLVAFCLTSCNDWLDVRPETEQKADDQFSSVGGFFDALVGAYMTMAEADAYGERMTISNIESLAGLWYMPEESNSEFGRLADWQLNRHDYVADEAREAIQGMFSGLFAVIAQANMILKYAEEQGSVFADTTMLAIVKGEAYALRAYCQLDVLRLFGQMPKNAKQQVELPYSLVTGIETMPAYYDFDAYVELLKNDLTQAKALLKDNDPLFQYTFDELNGEAEVPDDHLYYRQTHLNYWAVKALEARMLLYLGDTENANQVAKEIMSAKGVDGKPVREMSGATDFNQGYQLCPNEHLFALSKFDIMTNTESFLYGKAENTQYGENALLISVDMQTDLYAGEYLEGHNRYNNWWTLVKTNQGQFDYCAINKYWWDEDVQNQMLYYQLVPMLRMSEVYLIAMETTTSLADANELYKQYMAAHNVGETMAVGFASLEEMREWVIDEYRREFYAEGQMFYTYKRTGATQIWWQDKPADETVYVLPLPETEYNPNSLN